LKSVISINHIKTTPTHTNKQTNKQTKETNKQTSKQTNQPTNQPTNANSGYLNFEGTASQQNKLNTLNYFLFKMSWELQCFSAVLIILGH